MGVRKVRGAARWVVIGEATVLMAEGAIGAVTVTAEVTRVTQVNRVKAGKLTVPSGVLKHMRERRAGA
jgi:hypothetical protein